MSRFRFVNVVFELKKVFNEIQFDPNRDVKMFNDLQSNSFLYHNYIYNIKFKPCKMAKG